MSFQAYLDTVKAKTGKTPDDFARLAADKGLTRHGEVIAWLKAEFELGHGHANAIASVLLKPGFKTTSPDDRLDKLFSGKKTAWREAYDQLATQIAAFGPDAAAEANATYVNLLRGKKKFGIVQPGSARRLDIGIKLKTRPPEGRFEAAGAWNAMVTHRVGVDDPAQIDAELIAWLRAAYDATEVEV